MKSRISIFTRRGRSLRLLSISAVTRGYLSNSLVLSCGNVSVLCCQLLSRPWASSTDFLVASLRSGGIEYCRGNGGLDDGYLIREQVSWEKRRRKTRESAGLSITWTIQWIVEQLWDISTLTLLLVMVQASASFNVQGQALRLRLQLQQYPPCSPLRLEQSLQHF